MPANLVPTVTNTFTVSGTADAGFLFCGISGGTGSSDDFLITVDPEPPGTIYAFQLPSATNASLRVVATASMGYGPGVSPDGHIAAVKGDPNFFVSGNNEVLCCSLDFGPPGAITINSRTAIDHPGLLYYAPTASRASLPAVARGGVCFVASVLNDNPPFFGNHGRIVDADSGTVLSTVNSIGSNGILITAMEMWGNSGVGVKKTDDGNLLVATTEINPVTGVDIAGLQKLHWFLTGTYPATMSFTDLISLGFGGNPVAWLEAEPRTSDTGYMLIGGNISPYISVIVEITGTPIGSPTPLFTSLSATNVGSLNNPLGQPTSMAAYPNSSLPAERIVVLSNAQISGIGNDFLDFGIEIVSPLTYVANNAVMRGLLPWQGVWDPHGIASFNNQGLRFWLPCASMVSGFRRPTLLTIDWLAPAGWSIGALGWGNAW